MRRAISSIAAVVCSLGAAVVVADVPAVAEPNGYTQETVGGQDLIYEIDVSSGFRVLVGDTGLEPATRALVLGPDGTLYGENDGDLVTIDTSTGAATVVGSMGGGGATDMAFDSEGNLWMLAGNPSRLWSVDTATGAATLEGSLGQELWGLAGDCSGDLYAIGLSPTEDQLYLVDTDAVSASVVGPLGAAVGANTLDFAADGTLWMFSRPATPPGNSVTWTVDTSTGTATQVGVDGDSFLLAIDPLVCSAPSTTTTTTTSAPTTVPESPPPSALPLTPSFTG